VEDFAKESVNDMVIWRSTGKQLNNIIKQHGHGQLNFKSDSGKIFDGKEIKKTRILNTTDQDTQDTEAAAQPTRRERVFLTKVPITFTETFVGDQKLNNGEELILDVHVIAKPVPERVLLESLMTLSYH